MKFLLLLTTFSIAISSFASSTYQIEVVQKEQTTKRALLGGKVISSAVINLTSQLSGDIVKVTGVEGSYFKKGAEIITIESDSIKAQRDSSFAEISSAKEALKNAKVRYSQAIVSPNSNQMFGGMFNTFTDPMNQMLGNSNPDFDKYANRVEKLSGITKAKNRIKQAEANLKQINEKLANAIIRAPFDGVIVEKNINQGDIVQMGQSLIKFSNLKQLQVEVSVPSRLVRELIIGKQYRIRVDTLQNPVIATLVQIYPIADKNNHSIKIKLNLPKGLPILPGIYAELELSAKSGNRPPVIPTSSISWRSSLPSVFIVNKYNKTELRFIRVGSKIGNDKIEILTGLKAGQRIITNPSIYTTSGMSI